jgi:hypothetical protein
LKVKHDLSDLEGCIHWCMKNEARCKEIAKNGLDFATSILRKDFIKTYFQKLLWSLSDYQDPVKITTPIPSPSPSPLPVPTPMRIPTPTPTPKPPIPTRKLSKSLTPCKSRCRRPTQPRSKKVRKRAEPKTKTCKESHVIKPTNNRCVKKCVDGYTRRLKDFKCVKECADGYTRRLEDFKCIKNKKQ